MFLLTSKFYNKMYMHKIFVHLYKIMNSVTFVNYVQTFVK